jgi:hypothetical protein
MIKNFRLLSTGTFFIFIASHLIAQKAIGVFDRNADIGNVVYKGSVQYNPGAQQYIISGSGVNIWGTHDEFHYACRKLKGNFILQTRAVFLGKGVDPPPENWLDGTYRVGYEFTYGISGCAWQRPYIFTISKRARR